jgi:hypothetical protein
VQQIEGHVPQCHHVFSGMVLSDAAAIFMERDI